MCRRTHQTFHRWSYATISDILEGRQISQRLASAKCRQSDNCHLRRKMLISALYCGSSSNSRDAFTFAFYSNKGPSLPIYCCPEYVHVRWALVHMALRTNPSLPLSLHINTHVRKELES